MEGVWGIYVGYRWALYHKRVKHIVCVPKNQNWSKNMENPKIVENVNFIFLKFMTFWKKFYQYFPYFGQLWRNELLLTKIGPVPTNLLTKSENVRVWKLFFIKIYHQKINSRGQQDQNGVNYALSQLSELTLGLMKSWLPHSVKSELQNIVCRRKQCLFTIIFYLNICRKYPPYLASCSLALF